MDSRAIENRFIVMCCSIGPSIRDSSVPSPPSRRDRRKGATASSVNVNRKPFAVDPLRPLKKRRRLLHSPVEIYRFDDDQRVSPPRLKHAVPDTTVPSGKKNNLFWKERFFCEYQRMAWQ